MKKTTRDNRPAEWQKDPAKVTTGKVQFWRDGVMVTAQMSNADAREMVSSGLAFVICDQAIGALVNGQRFS